MVKNPPANAGDPGSIPGSGRSSGEGNGNPLQYSCLENPMDRGAQQATVHGVAESDTTEQSTMKQFCLELYYVFPDSSVGKESACNAGNQVESRGREDPLEKEMATHSSILVWKTPWTEKPGRLQSTGSKRVRHD